MMRLKQYSSVSIKSPNTCWMLILRNASKPLVNAPFNNPSEDDLTEIEVTDPMHPLFGRRFAVISLSTSQKAGHAVVVYQGHMRISPALMRINETAMRISRGNMRINETAMRIRIPLSATQLAQPRQDLGTKLTWDSVTELVALTKQYEVLCPSHPKLSGVGLSRNSKRPSAKISKPSCKR